MAGLKEIKKYIGDIAEKFRSGGDLFTAENIETILDKEDNLEHGVSELIAVGLSPKEASLVLVGVSMGSSMIVEFLIHSGIVDAKDLYNLMGGFEFPTNPSPSKTFH